MFWLVQYSVLQKSVYSWQSGVFLSPRDIGVVNSQDNPTPSNQMPPEGNLFLKSKVLLI